MGLSNLDRAEQTEIRRHIPERSGQKTETARRIGAVFQAIVPDQMVTGPREHRVAAIFDGLEPGRSGMVRTGPDILPFRAPEDSGQFGDFLTSAAVLLHAGETLPLSHNPGCDYQRRSRNRSACAKL